jgi:hypothetical protein
LHYLIVADDKAAVKSTARARTDERLDESESENFEHRQRRAASIAERKVRALELRASVTTATAWTKWPRD